MSRTWNGGPPRHNVAPHVCVTVWWTPNCGHTHCETDPPYISNQCPDGHPPPEQPSSQEPVDAVN